MVIDGVKVNCIVFYDKKTSQVCALVSDEAIVVPDNCDVAIFKDEIEPMFKEQDDMVVLAGAYRLPKKKGRDRNA